MLKPAVAIWKDGWLPKSETFIQAHLDELQRWSPVPIGYFTVADGLPVSPEVAPYSNSSVSKVLRTMLGIRPYRKRYLEILKGREVRAIHAHFGSGGINAMPLAKAQQLPLLTTFHGRDASTYGSKYELLNSRYRRKLSELFSKSALLLPVSRYVADALVKSGAPSEKIHLHYTGTQPVELVSCGGERNGIIFVGRLIEMKGVADLIAAYGRLPRGIRDVHPLRIVGEGPMRSVLAGIAEGRRLRVEFLGWKSPSDVQHLLARSAVFCGPSHKTATYRAEGFGMVYLEAALQELPVVGYLAGGTSEAVADGETGLLVPERSVAELSSALQTLLSDHSLAGAMGKAGRLRVLRDFNIRKQTRKLEDIYFEVASRA